MAKDPGYDLEDPALRASLEVREAPYWTALMVNRALGFRKPKAGTAYWVARYRRQNGKYRRIALGISADSVDPGDNALDFVAAKAKAIKVLGVPEVTSDGAEAFPLDRPAQLIYCPWGDTYTVGHALYDYAEWVRVACARSHFLGVRHRCNYYLLPSVGTLPADAMTRERLRDFIEDFFTIPTAMGSKRPSNRVQFKDLDEETVNKRKRTLNMIIGLLRSALQMAWEDGKIENERAWRCLRFVPYVKRRRLQFLNRAEAKQLVVACDPDLRALIMGALYTGCRANELIKMQVKDVAKEGFGIRVSPVKTYRPRFVFLSDEGMAFFLDQIDGKQEEDYVFRTKAGGKWTHRYAPRFKAAVASAGLPEATTFHVLRHTYASQLVQAGTPFSAVADQLGHSGPETVMMTYSHFAPQIRETEVRARFESLGIGASNEKEGASVATRFEQRFGGRRVRYADLAHTKHECRANFIRGDREVIASLRPEKLETSKGDPNSPRKSVARPASKG